MKYIVLIIDGAAGLPMPDKNNKTCLELAKTPNLDAIAKQATLGLARTVPPGMEPGSAVACMSVMGYNPAVYYGGRAAIEAASTGIEVGEGEAVFRCNLVNTAGGVMADYSGGHITTEEAAEIIKTLDKELGGDDIKFYPGVSYRHILKLKGHDEVLKAKCTPPHDIPGKPVKDFLPQGPGKDLLLDVMARSETVLKGHKINTARVKRGLVPITTIWLFWGCGRVPATPSFKKTYGLSAAMTSAVDLLKGLAKMANIDILDIKGLSDGPDNDNAGQAEGALKALDNHDLVIIHIEAPDEAGHGGHAEEKIKAIEDIDRDVIAQLRNYAGDLRVLVMPDHPTPIKLRTHTGDPVPFLIWGKGAKGNGAARFTEAEGKKTGNFIPDGYKIMESFLKK
jgi:2,3-bisphosphoglycerate-independent phosphoglycerate mutase